MADTTGPSPSPTPASLDAFVSYSRRDAEAVIPFVDRAKAAGRTFWMDADSIPPAAPWRTELGTAIEAADAVVCCLSPAWLKSSECRHEFERAVELGKRLVPVGVGDVENPPDELGALQWIDARKGRSPDDVVAAILSAIDTDPERVREHTHWLSRALRWETRDRDRSLLLRGKDLRAAEDWLMRGGTEPSAVPQQVQLVAASRRAERSRLRTTIVVALTTVVLLAVLAGVALLQRSEAVRQRDQAESRALAAAAQTQLDVDPERSVLLARLAWSTAPTSQATDALRAALQRSRVRAGADAHRAAVSGVAWSPDGALVITSGRDGGVAAWDASNGGPRGSFGVGPGAVQRLSAARSAPTGVATTDAGKAVLWSVDPTTGVLVLRAVLVETGATEATTSEDGRVIAVGMSDGTVRTWTSSGAPSITVGWARAPVRSVALSADGSTLLVGTEYGEAMVGRIEAVAPLVLAPYDAPVSTSQLSADGSTALTAADDGAASLRRTTDGAPVLALPSAFVVALDRAGGAVVVAQVSGQADLFRVGQPPRRLLAPGAPATDARFSVDGTGVVVTGLDGNLWVWRVADARVLIETRGAAGSATRGEMSPDGLRVVTGHGTGAVRLWALPDQPVELPLSGTDTLPPAGVDFSPDAATVLTASESGMARAWDGRSGAELPLGTACLTPPRDPGCLAARTLSTQGRLTRARFSPDGRLIVTSAQQGSLVVWDREIAGVVARPPDVGGPIDDVAFSPDGRQLVTAERRGVSRLIDVASGRVVGERILSPRGIYTASFTPGGGSVVVGGADGLVHVWDLGSGEVRVAADAGDGVLDLAVDPGGTQVALAVGDQVQVIDLDDGHRVLTLLGHQGFVTDVEYASPEALIVSGAMDGSARVWDARTGDEAAVYDVPGGDVTAVAVDRTGHRIAAASSAGNAFVFECEVCRSGAELEALAAARVTRPLSPEERARFAVP
ncbi:TIR domain-containing protein [Actinomycetospora aeridis]|uniref:TIR domain-containing protein n=1 Tax=Actinomycetospora aeridis TaxID=3129231 RepID=A0ABU8ND77_9PSEU